ncbi:hypothetical protein V5E97_05260 [Singulisphaera sp. Ch08]|uniref:Uncharacterized protein n=1 Tax=Singulisphaera sp. Ch08 TaxID=3120278 RepID=A0AAU7CK99_9BACT
MGKARLVQGLNAEMGRECYAGRCESMVFLCTPDKLEATTVMIGNKYNHEDEFAIIRVEAELLLTKRLSADATFEGGIEDMERSVREVGNLGCFDSILVEELSLERFIPNPEKSNLI